MSFFNDTQRAAIAAGGFSLILAAPAAANNLGENLAWQFRTSADIANQAAVQALIAQRRAGGFAAPNYVTNIARQYSCAITATATGNSGAQSALANSPTVSGASASASGNSNNTTASSGRSGSGVDSDQANSGAVSSSITGSTTSTIDGVAWQVLNSEQSNTGSQSANIHDASACAFGALN
jgi:hypothetical protein